MWKIRAIVLLVAGLSLPVTLAQSSGNVLLVVNNLSEDSQAVGRYYSLKRGLPSDRICPITTAPNETVSRAIYEREIRNPIVACLRRHRLQDAILYLVTTKGVPLLIEGDPGPVGDLASVDSELAMLYRFMAYGAYAAYGRVENPYFAAPGTAAGPRPFTRGEQELYLVTRLTGYSVVDVVFLIDRSLTPESAGGFVFDLPSQRRSLVSDWVNEAVSELRAGRFDVQLESTTAALERLGPVMGFCSGGSAGPGFQLPDQIEWMPGAIAMTFGPASARTFRRPQGQPKSRGNEAADFIAQGASGFGGQVADPTMDGHIRPQILFPAYTSGLNLAESFYRAIPYLSWRTVVVGDPLTSAYAPKTARLREQMANDFQIPLDPITGLPAEFSRRRALYFKQKYETTDEAVSPLLRGEGLLSDGDYPMAIAALERSLKFDPFILETHELLGQALERAGQFDRAFDRYSKALELNAHSKSLRVKLAEIAQHQLGDPHKAAPHAEWLHTRYGSREPDFVLRWAELSVQLGNPEVAEGLYLRLLEAAEPPLAALAGLGQIYHARGDWELAERFLGEALKRLDDLEAPEQHEKLQALYRDAANRLQPAASPAQAGGGPAAPGPETLVRPARIVSRTAPVYPVRAREAGIQGVVVLRLLIDEQGQLLKIKHIYGPQLLAEAFQEAVREWRFEPRLVRGRPEPSWLPVSIRFQLNKQ